MESCLKIGWLENAIHLPSKNYDDRPLETVVDLVVLHSISLPPEKFGVKYVCDFFLNKLDYQAHPYFEGLMDLRVAPHIFIGREGNVFQFVDLNKRAWHAGKSEWNGRQNCNDFSVGIELEGSDNQPFEMAQYDSLLIILKKLFKDFSKLKSGSVVGHSDVAPGRKTDPGPYFDWDLIRNFENSISQ